MQDLTPAFARAYPRGMALHSVAAVATAAGLMAAPAARPPTGPSLTVTPHSVERGHVVVISGLAGDCPTGDAVTILSRAFVHAHDFAGMPAVYAAVRPNGSFRTTTRIPAAKASGRYTVTARCGGGNLGVLRYLAVHR
jgi:hypothetical protein